MTQIERGRTDLEQTDGDREGPAGAPQRPTVVRNRPRVALEPLEDGRQLELALADRHEEPAGAERLLSRRAGSVRRLTRGRWAGDDRPGGGVEAEHVGDLLRTVLLAAPEDVALGAGGVAELVDGRHRAKGDEADEGGRREERERDDERLLERGQVLGLETRIDDVEEDGRHLTRPSERVLDRRVLG